MTLKQLTLEEYADFLHHQKDYSFLKLRKWLSY